MITALTHRKPLCFIQLSKGEKILTTLSLKSLENKMKYDYMDIDGERISTAKNIVRKYGIASDVDHFEYYILPQLPYDEQNWWKGRMRHTLSDRTPSLKVLLEKLKEYRKEQEYYSDNGTIEREKIKQIVARDRAKYSFLQH